MLHFQSIASMTLILFSLSLNPLEAMTKVIAHRGASCEAPENTLDAYQKALEIGADCMETDVHLSVEGVPVCRHDPRFDDHRSWKGPSLLSDMTVEQIKERSRYGAQAEVPMLEEILLLERKGTALFVELKDDCSHPKELVDAVCELTSKYSDHSDGTLYMGSFSTEIVQLIQEAQEADAVVGLVEFEEELEGHLRLQPDIIGIDDAIATEECIEQLLDQGVEVWVWTVDDLERGALLADLGASAIITNNPRAMIERLSKK